MSADFEILNVIFKTIYLMKTENNENEALNKTDVSSRYITLKRDDLIEWKKDIPIQEVTITDFKSTSVTMDEILRAYYILFSDGNIHKVLKDRFA